MRCLVFILYTTDLAYAICWTEQLTDELINDNTIGSVINS